MIFGESIKGRRPTPQEITKFGIERYIIKPRQGITSESLYDKIKQIYFPILKDLGFIDAGANDYIDNLSVRIIKSCKQYKDGFEIGSEGDAEFIEYLEYLAGEVLDEVVARHYIDAPWVLESSLRRWGDRLVNTSKLIYDYINLIGFGCEFDCNPYPEIITEPKINAAGWNLVVDRLEGLQSCAEKIVLEKNTSGCYKDHAWFFSVLGSAFDVYYRHPTFPTNIYKKNPYGRHVSICRELASQCEKLVLLKEQEERLTGEIEELKRIFG